MTYKIQEQYFKNVLIGKHLIPLTFIVNNYQQPQKHQHLKGDALIICEQPLQLRTTHCHKNLESILRLELRKIIPS